VGLTFLLPFVLVFSGEHGDTLPMVIVNLWITGGMMAGHVSLKLAYPHAASDELYAAEPPLTLFPK